MIIGIGSDLTDIRRIEKAINRFGDRFINRIFTKGEQARAHSRPNPVFTYAKRFAAKEACAKAIGGGLWRGVSFTHIEVINYPKGRPAIVLSDAAYDWVHKQLPSGEAARIHLTITDDYPYAQAFVVIEAVDLSRLQDNEPINE